MDKVAAARERPRLSKELADLWAEAGKVQEQLMDITKRGQAGNWDMERYMKERAPLQAQKTALGERIKVLTDQLAAADKALGL